MSEAEQIYKGGCICGSVSYRIIGKPIRSVYCHCTLCQRLNACAFIHTIHFPASAFTWTHKEPHGDAIETYSVESKPWKVRSRCKNCGRSIWSAQLERDELGKIKYWDILKPTGHIFYGMRMLDIHDDLAKWEGYNDDSNRLG
ncbi:Mss4-like protein [Amanita rubescens]|nr:Mss4-like protein [Amanita rubescens]